MYSFDVIVSENKAFEFSIGFYDNMWGIEFLLHRKPKDWDHTGWNLCITIINLYIEMDFYDLRHKEDYEEE